MIKKPALTLFIVISIFTSSCMARDYQLRSLTPDEFKQISSIVQRAITTDDSKIHILPFDEKQSFILIKQGNLLGYLLPVTFNSLTYRNTICRLFLIGPDQNQVGHADLFAEKGDGDEVVSSCVGVEAVSIKEINQNEFLYLALVRHRVVNTYSSTGVAVSYKDGKLFFDHKLNSCIQKETISNISYLRKRTLSCLK